MWGAAILICYPLLLVITFSLTYPAAVLVYSVYLLKRLQSFNFVLLQEQIAILSLGSSNFIYHKGI